MTAGARKRLLVLASLVVATAPFAACATRRTGGAGSAVRSELAPDVAARVDAIFAPWNHADSPGCAIAIVRDGAIVYARGYGSANLEHDIPITPSTVFDIGSTSKQFTAACVALLSIDGKLSLDDDARKWIPELPDYGATITLRHLLHHTSGIRDYCELMMIAGFHSEDFTTDDQALDVVVHQRALNFPPGTKHEYSNSGYFLLSIVVERAAGMSLAAFARERIFERLGMSDTHIHDDHTRVVPRRAAAYAPRREGGFAIDMSDWEQTGDGAVMTTVEDLAKWARNFETGEVGGPRFLELMQSHGALSDGSPLAYGFGLVSHEWRGFQTISHGGAWVGYRAQLLRFPSERLAIVCLCNLADMNPGALVQQVAEVMLEGRLEPEEETSRPASAPETAPASEPAASESVLAASEPAPPAPDLNEFAGAYACDELSARYALFARDGALWVRVRGNPDGPLPWIAPDAVSSGGVTLRFQRDANGRVAGFLLDTGRVHRLQFVRTQ